MRWLFLFIKVRFTSFVVTFPGKTRVSLSFYLLICSLLYRSPVPVASVLDVSAQRAPTSPAYLCDDPRPARFSYLNCPNLLSKSEPKQTPISLSNFRALKQCRNYVYQDRCMFVENGKELCCVNMWIWMRLWIFLPSRVHAQETTKKFACTLQSSSVFRNSRIQEHSSYYFFSF